MELRETSTYYLLKKFSEDNNSHEELEQLIRECIRICHSQLLAIKECNSATFKKEKFSDNYNITLKIVSNLFNYNNNDAYLKKQLKEFYFDLEDETDAQYFLHRVINIELKQRISGKYENISLLA